MPLYSIEAKQGRHARPAPDPSTGALDRYRVQRAGGRDHLEYWIPAEQLSAFNAALVGEIEVIAEYP
jgi:hypothetical protein